MVAPKSAVFSTHPAAGDSRELAYLLWRDGLPGALDRGPCPFGVDARLIAGRLQFLDACLERRIGNVGDTGLDRVVKAL
ncbi:hypothetical protein [Palleronia rufa]|nr:hypothetical protein [Palleronia rufa]